MKKYAVIVPDFEKGDKTSVTDYIHISIFNPLSKLSEFVTREHISYYYNTK
jgi:hypothetical protein